MCEKELLERIRQKKKERNNAGYIHKKDLNREIRRLEKELMIYYHYRKEAAKSLKKAV